MTATFRFRVPGMAFDSVGTIIGVRGTRALIEGRDDVAGKYFIKGMRGVQAFKTKLAADKAFAKDGPEYKPPKEKPWDRPGDPPREAKDQGPGISVHGAAERGRDPHENPYVEYDIPDTRSGKDALPREQVVSNRKRIELAQWIKRNPDDAREYPVDEIMRRFDATRADAEWAYKEAQK